MADEDKQVMEQLANEIFNTLSQLLGIINGLLNMKIEVKSGLKKVTEDAIPDKGQLETAKAKVEEAMKKVTAGMTAKKKESEDEVKEVVDVKKELKHFVEYLKQEYEIAQNVAELTVDNIKYLKQMEQIKAKNINDLSDIVSKQKYDSLLSILKYLETQYQKINFNVSRRGIRLFQKDLQRQQEEIAKAKKHIEDLGKKARKQESKYFFAGLLTDFNGLEEHLGKFVVLVQEMRNELEYSWREESKLKDAEKYLKNTSKIKLLVSRLKITPADESAKKELTDEIKSLQGHLVELHVEVTRCLPILNKLLEEDKNLVMSFNQIYTNANDIIHSLETYLKEK